MTVTLVDMLKRETHNPLKKGFIADLLRYSDLLRLVPFTEEEALQVNGHRWQTLPSVGFRKFGGGYSESTGTTESERAPSIMAEINYMIDKSNGS